MNVVRDNRTDNLRIYFNHLSSTGAMDRAEEEALADKVSMVNAMRKKARMLSRGKDVGMEELVEELAVEMDVPVEEVKLIIRADKTCRSLDDKLGDGADRRLMDILPDTMQE